MDGGKYGNSKIRFNREMSLACIRGEVKQVTQIFCFISSRTLTSLNHSGKLLHVSFSNSLCTVTYFPWLEQSVTFSSLDSNPSSPT